MALRDVLSAAQVFPLTPVDTPAGRLPLRAVMVAIANVENPGWGNQAGDRLGEYGTLPDGTPYQISPSESRNAKWNCNGYTSWGTWQINLPANHDLVTALSGITDPCAMAQWLSDYTNNALVAAHLVGNGDGLSNWTSYTHSNKWQQFIPQGMQASGISGSIPSVIATPLPSIPAAAPLPSVPATGTTGRPTTLPPTGFFGGNAGPWVAGGLILAVLGYLLSR